MPVNVEEALVFSARVGRPLAVSLWPTTRPTGGLDRPTRLRWDGSICANRWHHSDQPRPMLQLPGPLISSRQRFDLCGTREKILEFFVSADEDERLLSRTRTLTATGGARSLSRVSTHCRD